MNEIDQINNLWVVDIEQFKNMHSLCALNIYTNERKEFVLHPSRDERKEYIQWLESKPVWITFNGINYDYPVVHRILKFKDYFLKNTIQHVVYWLYKTSCKIIESEYSAVPKYESLIDQYDLYRIHHFNNRARATSLKSLEFYMRWPNLQDLPFSPHKSISIDEIDLVQEYCWNDVEATKKFWDLTVEDGKIELRHELSDKYQLDLYNADDVKIGTELFAKFLAEEQQIGTDQLKRMQTKRHRISLDDCILDYIKFDSKEFSSVLDFFKSKNIINTKAVFKDIDLDEFPSLGKHAYLKEVKEGKIKKLCVDYKGVAYYYGTGGLHGANKSGIYESDADYDILDVDVASYYPNIAINNKFRPEHLGESFTKIYKDIYLQRKKIPKSNPLNYAFKLMLNGSFGKSNDKYSFLLDRAFLLKITLNGQLLLTMLLEQVLKACPKTTVIQANTDGITFKVHRDEMFDLKQVCKSWEELTGLELEYARYSKFIMRDVNNYIAIYDSGKVKYKGVFEIDRDPHKNHSQRIVPIALARYYIDDVPIEDTINNHMQKKEYTDIDVKAYGAFDFCKKVRSKSSPKKGKSEFYYVYNNNGELRERKLQKVNRYIMTNKGGRLIKKYEDGSSQYVEAASSYSIVLNQFKSLPADVIDYKYYIAECRKVMNSVSDIKNKTQLQLF